MEDSNYYLEKRISELENEIQTLKDQIPKTKLLSSNFFSRSFAVLGYNMVASLMVSIPLYILLIILATIFIGHVPYPDYGY